MDQKPIVDETMMFIHQEKPFSVAATQQERNAEMYERICTILAKTNYEELMRQFIERDDQRKLYVVLSRDVAMDLEPYRFKDIQSAMQNTLDVEQWDVDENAGHQYVWAYGKDGKPDNDRLYRLTRYFTWCVYAEAFWVIGTVVFVFMGMLLNVLGMVECTGVFCKIYLCIELFFGLMAVLGGPFSFHFIYAFNMTLCVNKQVVDSLPIVAYRESMP